MKNKVMKWLTAVYAFALIFGPFAGWASEKAMAAGDGILSNAVEDYTKADGTLKMLNGETKGEQREFTQANDVGAVDGKAFRFDLPTNTTYLSDTVIFGESVAVSGSGGIVIRIYAHLSNDGRYSLAAGGIRFYGVGADGHTAGYLLSENIEQNQWVSVRLTEAEAEAIADENGEISGFMIGAGLNIEEEDVNPYILIDYVAEAEERVVKLDDEELIVINGMTVGVPQIPEEKDGKVFCGWLTITGKSFDFSCPVLNDVSLTSYWRETKDGFIAEGLYEGTDGNIFVFEDGSVKVPESALKGQVIGYAHTADDILVVYTTAGMGVTLFDLSEDSENYERAENSHKIVYRTGLPEKDIIEYVKDGQKTKAPEVERSGYVLTDWMNGKTPFDFNIVIEADYTLTAAWGYEEAADSGAFFGFYYDSASDIIIELKKDNAAVYDGQNCEYYILSSHEIIFEKADGVMSGTAYFSRLDLNGDFIRLQDCYVTFYDGEEILEATRLGRQTVTAATGWKVPEKVVDPVKEGFIFVGWVLEDGSTFDFNAVVPGGLNVLARWEKDSNYVENENEENSGAEEKKGCGSAASFVSVISAALVLALVRRKNSD